MTPEERKQMNSLVVGIQQEKDYTRFEALLRELNALIARKELQFPQHHGSSASRGIKPWRKCYGIVQRIFKNVEPDRGDTIEIAFADAEELFREIRIENRFTDAAGQTVALKQGSHVDITFEADQKDTIETENRHRLYDAED
jgi:hypothetical protein